MFLSHRDAIEKKKQEHPSMKNVTKQILIGPEQGWNDHVMRLFTLGKGGYTARHTHPWPHVMYVVEGKGNLFINGENHLLVPGSVAFVPSEDEHQISNAAAEDFVFICIVPKIGEA